METPEPLSSTLGIVLVRPENLTLIFRFLLFARALNTACFTTQTALIPIISALVGWFTNVVALEVRPTHAVLLRTQRTKYFHR